MHFSLFDLAVPFTKTVVHVPMQPSYGPDDGLEHSSFTVYSQPSKANPRELAYFVAVGTSWSFLGDGLIWRAGITKRLGDVIHFVAGAVGDWAWNACELMPGQERVVLTKSISLTRRSLIKRFCRYGTSLGVARATLAGVKTAFYEYHYCYKQWQTHVAAPTADDLTQGKIGFRYIDMWVEKHGNQSQDGVRVGQLFEMMAAHDKAQAVADPSGPETVLAADQDAPF